MINNPNARKDATEDNQADPMVADTLSQDNKLDSSRLLTLFPKEIWLQILENVFQPKDLYHVEKAACFFEHLLQNMKTKILFPEVIKIFVIKFYWKPKNTQEVLLTCRLVCRTWEIGVNSVLHSYFNPHKLLEADPQAYTKLLQPITTSVLTTENTIEFLQRFDEDYARRNRNPFICSSLYIDFRNQRNDVAAFTQGTLQILRNYGHNVLKFKALLHHTDVASYERLPEFLKYMPNIKVLVIECNINFGNDQLEALELSMQSSVFPALQSLQQLQLLEQPRPVFDAFLRNYSQVSVLLTKCYLSKTIDAIYTQQLPNLTQLALCIESNERLIPLIMSKAIWPLKALRVRVGHVGAFTFDWQKLFQILENRWAATLTELWIAVRNSRVDRPVNLFPCLNLPKLEVLVLQIDNFVSLDFSLPLRNSLKQFVVLCVFVHTDAAQFEANQKIKFYSFREDLKNSNIWALFPKLESVQYWDREIRGRRCNNPRSYCKPELTFKANGGDEK